MQCLRIKHASWAFHTANRWLISRGSCSKLFVGGLSYDTNESVLKDAFEKFGEIIQVKVICNHRTAKSEGYGFVHFASDAAASIALQKMDGQLLDGRNIRVQYANKGR
ncbi:PREDICTED: glycine-rich RNA-binding protein 2, mitochondrial-like [Nelumbo nucifera]|uniref:Glycine-rich RNA-binding protein 2, mitochondrial-like n=2 Tax=Nelumbo nucifera TaxID=4432 RepID=A0A1U8A5D4_NELNU|nr:PREDICTED: glycine-rich RNA-binding protein 2, mitochondrial-like [Nelumbo nucifera]XP_010260087.1 PREDICTED: glycine-rich RNA-binding protein 2, mitochondrial-like [Nelumbo nucifera]DAD27854.1 TPA_asm: hypothetical protein HUJ06_029322 [Nelumbo nucifera]